MQVNSLVSILYFKRAFSFFFLGQDVVSATTHGNALDVPTTAATGVSVLEVFLPLSQFLPQLIPTHCHTEKFNI